MKPILWKNDHATLIDQTLLPLREVWIDCRELEDYADAIRSMKIRGAPAIGITAAYGLAGVALQTGNLDKLEEAGKILAATRPTAVNLFWAIDRILCTARGAGSNLVQAVVDDALALAREDEAMCHAMGDHGADLLEKVLAGKKNLRILTHCNAGALATGDYGTALGVIRSAHARGLVEHVWVDETRPFLQGARLTAWELMQDGVPVKLICDNMAGHFMQRGQVDLVVVGSDRIAANGDVANKIGTYSLAVLCNYHKIPFWVAAPTSTVDELRCLNGVPIAPRGVPVANPAFDVTPCELVTAIITEQGVVQTPYGPGLAEMLSHERASVSRV
jgi:methylthioribose-1-phosphate isomerase